MIIFHRLIHFWVPASKTIKVTILFWLSFVPVWTGKKSGQKSSKSHGQKFQFFQKFSKKFFFNFADRLQSTKWSEIIPSSEVNLSQMFHVEIWSKLWRDAPFIKEWLKIERRKIFSVIVKNGRPMKYLRSGYFFVLWRHQGQSDCSETFLYHRINFQIEPDQRDN